MNDELPALGMGERRRERELDTELMRPMRLAFADAFELGRMQAEDAQIRIGRRAFDRV